MSVPIFGLLPAQPAPEPGLTHAVDHVARAQGVLLSQLRDKTRFMKFVEIFVRPLQELEDVFWALIVNRRLATAVGVQLDVIGKIVDEPRGGLNDTDYRAVLRVKGRVLRSKGTADDLIEIAQLMLGVTPFMYDEFYPGTVVISLLDEPVFSAALLTKFLRKAKMGGIRLNVVGGIEGSGTFRYGDANVPTTDMLHSYNFGQYAGDI